MATTRNAFDVTLNFKGVTTNLSDMLDYNLKSANNVQTKLTELLKSNYSDENFLFLQDLHKASQQKNPSVAFKEIIANHIDEKNHKNYYINIETAEIKALQVYLQDDKTPTLSTFSSVIRIISGLIQTNMTQSIPQAKLLELHDLIKPFNSDIQIAKIKTTQYTENFKLDTKAVELAHSLETLETKLKANFNTQAQNASTIAHIDSQISAHNRAKHLLQNCLSVIDNFNAQSTTQKTLITEFTKELKSVIDNQNDPIRPDILCQDLISITKGIMEKKKLVEKEPIIGDSPFLKTFQSIVDQAAKANPELNKVMPQPINFIFNENIYNKSFHDSTHSAIEKLAGSDKTTKLKDSLQTFQTHLSEQYKTKPDVSAITLHKLIENSLNFLQNYKTDNVNKHMLLGVLTQKIISICEKPNNNPLDACKDLMASIKGIQEKNIQLESRQMPKERASQSSFVKDLAKIIDIGNENTKLAEIKAAQIATPAEASLLKSTPSTLSVTTLDHDSKEEESLTRSRSGTPRP